MRETFYCSSCCPAGAFQGMTYLGGCNGCGRSAYCVRVEAPGSPAARTREDVERLKAEWLRDDWDGLEDAPGYEAFHAELKAFREEHERRWAEREQGRRDHAEKIALSMNLPLNVRDDFAVAALNGLLVAEAEGDERPFRDYARAAYAIADAMLIERLKESKP
jgi:hypothetical protein